MPKGIYIRTLKYRKEQSKRMESSNNPIWDTKRPKKVKDKISQTLKEFYKDKRNHPWYKRKHSEKSKEKMKRSALKRPKVSLKTRQKQSLKSLKYWKDPAYRENQLKKGIFQDIRNRPTSLEKEFIELINKFNLLYRYVGDNSFWINNGNPDFIHLNKKICVEVHNFYHHKNNYRKKRANQFSKLGWKTVFIDQDEIKDQDKVLNLLSYV